MIPQILGQGLQGFAHHTPGILLSCPTVGPESCAASAGSWGWVAGATHGAAWSRWPPATAAAARSAAARCTACRPGYITWTSCPRRCPCESCGSCPAASRRAAGWGALQQGRTLLTLLPLVRCGFQPFRPGALAPLPRRRGCCLLPRSASTQSPSWQVGGVSLRVTVVEQQGSPESKPRVLCVPNFVFQAPLRTLRCWVI